jgi:two-component system sensor histidine kinase AlgZ
MGPGGARRAQRIELVDPAAGPLLPPGLFWVYCAAPFLFAPLIRADLFTLPRLEALRAFGSIVVPFIGLPLAFHLFYNRVVPRLLRRIRGGAGRFVFHATASTGIALVMALPLHRLSDAVCGHPSPQLRFVLICVVMSWVNIFPALIVQHHRRRTLDVERLAQAERQAALEAQLQALQARTNPHFFFNSLNTVAGLIPSDPALAERTLERLAEIFRYALDSARTRLVPLRRELEIVRDYLAIQEARFGARLRTRVELDERIGDTPVPPLVLQPLVENAILHGLHARDGGVVAVVARREGDRVLIEVSDDGPGPGASAHQGTRTSVDELKHRLDLLYGAAGRLELGPGALGGTLVRLSLPAKEAQPA